MLVPTYTECCTGDAPLLALARKLDDADLPEHPAGVPDTARRGDNLESCPVYDGREGG